MKAYFPVFTLVCVLISSITASENLSSPQIRVQTQWIELSHSEFSKMINRASSQNNTLHEIASQLVQAKKAKIIDSSIITTRNGDRASVQSNQDFISPSDYELSSIPNTFPTQANPQLYFPPILRPTGSCPAAFETRLVGCMLDVEATIIHEQQIELRFDTNWTHMPKMLIWAQHTDQWGNADIKRPLFSTMQFNSGLTINNDQYIFASAFSPTDKNGKLNLTKKVLLFVKATLIPLG